MRCRRMAPPLAGRRGRGVRGSARRRRGHGPIRGDMLAAPPQPGGWCPPAPLAARPSPLPQRSPGSPASPRGQRLRQSTPRAVGQRLRSYAPHWLRDGAAMQVTKPQLHSHNSRRAPCRGYPSFRPCFQLDHCLHMSTALDLTLVCTEPNEGNTCASMCAPTTQAPSQGSHIRCPTRPHRPITHCATLPRALRAETAYLSRPRNAPNARATSSDHKIIAPSHAYLYFP